MPRYLEHLIGALAATVLVVTIVLLGMLGAAAVVTLTNTILDLVTP